MYQALHFEYPNRYWLRDDNKGWSEFEHRPTFYRIDDDGEYPTLDGKFATPTTTYVKNDNNLYERDIDPKTRLLIDLYRDEDNAPSFQNRVFFDIETEIIGTLTTESIKQSLMKMTSVAIYAEHLKKWFCLVLDEEGIMINTNKDNKKIIFFKTETEMLLAFLSLWKKLDATIITGWNSAFFDVPFLYYRIRKILGEEYANQLSPIGKIKINEWLPDSPIEIAGLNHLDYMLLYKKFVTKQEPSYKLNDIGERYVNLGKIEYEGSLDTLFKENINKFIEYNLRDVEIIIELEKKFAFMDLAVNICHLCHVPYSQIFLSTSLNDGAILTYLKRKGIVSPNKPTTTNPVLKELYEEYAGGYLKDPIPGLYEWVIDLDFTSLYPSIIRSLNIGIETLAFRIANYDKYDNNWTLNELKELDPEEDIIIEFLTDEKTLKSKNIKIGKLIKIIESEELYVAASGALFRRDKSSVVKDVLTDWFNKRKEYKDLMKEAYKIKNDPELGEFYNRLQHAYKIKLNDVYGCYAINGWRYTDGNKIISKAITLTGQRVTQESIKFVNIWMNNKLKTKDIDYVVTSDTDSLFIQVKDLALQYNPELINQNRDKWVEVILEITKEIQKAANENINKVAREYFNIKTDEHYFELKQEVILERGYFAGKRRYAMFIVNKEGIPIEELDMKGLDLMKSNMTPIFKKFGTSLIQSIMYGAKKEEIDKKIVDFKTDMKKKTIDELAKPTGVKKIKEYLKSSPKNGEIFSQLMTKCPINTKAAIYYNDIINFHKIGKKYPYIVEGDKMKYIQLIDNPFKIDVIGFKGNEDPDEIKQIINDYADRDLGFESTLLNKLMGIYEDLKWDFPSLNENVNKFFKF